MLLGARLTIRLGLLLLGAGLGLVTGGGVRLLLGAAIGF